MSDRHVIGPIAALLTLALGACTPSYQRLDGGVIALAQHRVTLTAPSGWIRIGDDDDRVVLTRHGDHLHSMQVAHGEPRVLFGHQRPQPESGADLDRLADRYLSTLTHHPLRREVQETDRAETTLGGLPAFYLQTEWTDRDAVRMRQDAIGLVTTDGAILAAYTAPRTYFHARDLPVFEALLSSVTLVPRATH